MLRIRLQRRGRSKRPIHHIVVADSRKPRDGRIIEDLGRFDNVTPKNQLDLDYDRALYWLQEGAQPSDTVRSIFKKQGLMYHMHLLRLNKSEEEIEETLSEWREKRAEKEEDVPTRKERQQALLDAEEKEFQKQLKKKAEEAAKEKAKQEALASDDEDEDEDSDDEQEADDTEAADTEEAAEESEETVEKQDESSDDAEEAEASADEESDSEEDADEEEQSADETTEEEPVEEESAEQEADESDADEEEEQDDDEETSDDSDNKEQVSSDMLAKEAIAHIENTPLDELEGFVTDDEDRVTVQRALDEKKED